MRGQWSSRCGGRPWRTLPNWQVELQSSGVPLWQPGGGGQDQANFKNLQNSWESWGSLIRRSARQQGLPPSWILAFINAETGHKSDNPAVQASCGPWSRACRNTCCAGLMQVMVTPYKNYKTFGGYDRPEDMLDPRKAIDTGAKMLARMTRKSDWELPAIASSYNQGPGDGRAHCPGGQAHTCASSAWAMCSDPGYITRVVKGNNSAIQFLGVNAGGLPWLAYVAAGFVVLGGGLFIARRMRR